VTEAEMKLQVLKRAVERIASPNQPSNVGFDYARRIASEALQELKDLEYDFQD